MVEIPQRLRKFPTWNGYVVHFTLPVDKDGKPQFRSLNRDKQVQCANQSRCHLCGEKLYPPYWFIAAKWEVEEKVVSSNGPMHEECARYAIAACPFLSNPNYQSKANAFEGRSLGVVLDMIAHGSTTGYNMRSTERIALCTAAGYRCDTKKQILDFVVPDWLHLDWDAIPSRAEDTLAQQLDLTLVNSVPQGVKDAIDAAIAQGASQPELLYRIQTQIGNRAPLMRTAIETYIRSRT